MSLYWGQNQRYYSYSHYIKKFFPGKTQKLSVNAGFTCPNRDGTKGIGGCTYCNNRSFQPDYCVSPESVQAQLKEGIRFFSKYRKPNQFLAYFQSFSNTYAPVDHLEKLYAQALKVPEVKGLVISTRPDCLEEEKLELLEELARHNFVSLEIGIESCNEHTLASINRCCTFEEAQNIIYLASGRGFEIGAHIILGLPGEYEEDFLSHADKVSNLPVNTLKIHQLQIVRGTRMAKQFSFDPNSFQLFTLPEYLQLMVKFLERLNPSIAIERFVNQSPKDLLIQPKWGMKNFEIAHLISQSLESVDSWQGKKYLEKATIK